jgi:hypothetical protein
MKRLSTWVAMALLGWAGACADPTLAPATPSTRAALFDDVWRDTDLLYSMFALKHVSWDSVRTVYRPRALAATTDADFAKVLADMLRTLHDRHVSLTPSHALPMGYATASDSIPAALDIGLIERRYLDGPLATTNGGGHVRHGRVSPTVGYIRIATFSGKGWDGEIDAALQALDDVKALIVDVRSNAGGSYDLALSVAGRFADRVRPFGRITLRNGPRHDDFGSMINETVGPAGARQFRGPVYVLTDDKVYSSGENFVLAMTMFPNIVTLGDTTGGSSGKPVVRELSNGWTYQVSTWIEYTLDGRTVEDHGIAPAVVVHSRMADIIAGTDPVLERAIALAEAR